MDEERIEQLLNHPFIRALLAGGMAVPINPNGARADFPGGAVVNFYESGGNVIMQVYSPTAGAWKAVTLS